MLLGQELKPSIFGVMKSVKIMQYVMAAAASLNGTIKQPPVASFKANKFGLHDMHGNVWEWVQYCYHENYNNAPSDGSSWEVKNVLAVCCVATTIFRFPARAIIWSIFVRAMITILHPFINIAMHII